VPAGAPSDALARRGEEAAAAYRRGMDAFAIHEGAAAAFSLVDATNEFIASTAPWQLAKDNASADRLTQVLFDAAEAIRLAAVLLTPIMPASSAEILRRVGAPSSGLHLDRDGRWRNDGERVLKPEGPLWPRYEPDRPAHTAGADRRVGPAKELSTVADNAPPSSQPTPAAPSSAAPAPASSAPAPAERIAIDDFMKVELRVAKVVAAERVPKSSRLLKLQVDVGSEQRTLVAGIAEAYEPETLVGKSVIVVFNLKPAKLMGVESNGMVLAASPEGGKPIVATFETPPAPGTRVR